MVDKKENNVKEESNKFFIENIIKKYKDRNYIKITGKNLYYIPNTTIFRFFCIIQKSNDFNPFYSDIYISFEFIDEKSPYINILNDFINPSLNDGTNIFYCLTNQHNYIFKKENLYKLENMFDELIEGLKNFLLCLKENIEINTFIFYGSFAINDIYQINDFILNKITVKLFRIIQINEKNKELKYIVITQLYLLMFKPLDNDMSLAKLEQFYYLKDIDASFSILYNKNKGKFHLKLFDTIANKEIIIDFIFNEYFHDDYINNNNVIDEENKYLEFKKIFFLKKNEIDFKKYKIVITNYKPLFTIDNKKTNNSSRNIEENNLYNDYKLYIKYYEALIEYYKNTKDENMKKRLKKYYDYLNYCCVDFITNNSSNLQEVKLYQSKIIKFIDNK